MGEDNLIPPVQQAEVYKEIPDELWEREGLLRLESPEPLSRDHSGQRVSLSGEGAVARGLLEAGCEVVTSFPGTPTNWATDMLAPIADKFDMYLESSVNEKIALEVAAAAAIDGRRAAMLTKDFGINVACDSLRSLVMGGVSAGLVIIVGGHPGGWKSNSDMDARNHARTFRLPCLQPATPQETKDYVLKAFKLSEACHVPVMVFLSVPMAWSRAAVVLGELPSSRLRGEPFDKSPKWPSRPSGHKSKQQEEPLSVAERLLTGDSAINRLEVQAGEEMGIIYTGQVEGFLKEALKSLGISDVALLKVGSFNPLPRKLFRDMLQQVKRVLVLEDGDPLIEAGLLETAGLTGKHVETWGKNSGHSPKSKGLTPDLVLSAVAKFVNKEDHLPEDAKAKERREILGAAPVRPSDNCPGCPHRASYYVLRQAINRADVAYIATGTDAGCGTIAKSQPGAIGGITLSMGSSIGLGSGFSHVEPQQKVITVVGDANVLHAGLPALLNSSFNYANILVCVLDNNCAAQTGHQSHAAAGISATGQTMKNADWKDIARMAKYDVVEITDPYKLRPAEDIVYKALLKDGQRMVVFSRECALTSLRKEKRQGTAIKLRRVDERICTGCGICTNYFMCPAIFMRNSKAWIDDVLCRGCAVCDQVCPTYAIREVRAP